MREKLYHILPWEENVAEKRLFEGDNRKPPCILIAFPRLQLFSWEYRKINWNLLLLKFTLDNPNTISESAWGKDYGLAKVTNKTDAEF